MISIAQRKHSERGSNISNCEGLRRAVEECDYASAKILLNFKPHTSKDFMKKVIKGEMI